MDLTVADRKKILSDLVQPYKRLFESTHALVPTVRLIDFVAAHSDCPSVVIQNRRDVRRESEEGNFQILEKITLFDHSVRVARLSIDLTRRVYRLNNLVPPAIVAAIAHDIGKAPDVRGSEYYLSANHPLTATRHLSAIFDAYEVPWYPVAEQAVLRHHLGPLSDFDTITKDADSAARQEEVRLVTSGTISYRPLKQWLEAGEFLRFLSEKVNVIDTAHGSYCGAFTWKNIVFCRPDTLFEIARTLAIKTGVIDMDFYHPRDREERRKVLVAIVDVLRAAEALALPVAAGYFGRRFVAKYRNGTSVQGFFVPIVLDAFRTTPLEFRNRRDGYLCEIIQVKPAAR